jgi:hypothetical protein
MLVTKTYQVELLEHPKEGAQEWLGNTQHMFTELVDTAIQDRNLIRDGKRTYTLYRDPKGKKSDTGTYFWSPYGFTGTSIEHEIETLYGPVVIQVKEVQQ